MTFNKFMNIYALIFIIGITYVFISYAKRYFKAKKNPNVTIVCTNTPVTFRNHIYLTSTFIVISILSIAFNLYVNGVVDPMTFFFLTIALFFITYSGVIFIDDTNIRFYFSKKIKITTISKLVIQENKKSQTILVIYTSKYDTITVKGNSKENIIHLYNYLSNIKALATN